MRAVIRRYRSSCISRGYSSISDSGRSRSNSPRSAKRRTRYAKTGLLSEAASKIVPGRSGDLALSFMVPNAPLQMTRPPLTTAIERPATPLV